MGVVLVSSKNNLKAFQHYHTVVLFRCHMSDFAGFVKQVTVICSAHRTNCVFLVLITGQMISDFTVD